MTSAAIVYMSRTGTTRQFAEEIGDFLATRGIECRVEPIDECDVQTLGGVDYLLLGCWTSGLFIAMQHADRPWVEFAHSLPVITGPRAALFTTYKLATGSMFRNMRKHLAGKTAPIGLELRSRDGHLSGDHKLALERFIA